MEGMVGSAVDWRLLENPVHQQSQNFSPRLNWFYREHPALYSNDRDWKGFEWIDHSDTQRSIFSFLRCSAKSIESPLIFVYNFIFDPKVSTYCTRYILNISLIASCFHKMLFTAHVRACRNAARSMNIRTFGSFTFEPILYAGGHAKNPRGDKLHFRPSDPRRPAN